MILKQNLLSILQERRKELNISQNELAIVLGLSQGQFSSIVNGRSEMSIDKLIKLCEYLKLDIKIYRNEDKERDTKEEVIQSMYNFLDKLKEVK